MYTSFFRKAMLGDTATLNLDFTTGVLDSRLTFTRASTATYITSSGYIASMGAAVTNDPTKARFDYDPTTLAPRGLLIEGSAINYMLYSVDLTQTNSKMRAVSTASITDPEGTTDKARIVAADGQTGYHARYLATTAGTNTTVTISIFAKKNGYKYLNISDLGLGRAAARFDLDDGTTSNTLGAGFVSASAIAYPNGWWRCSLVSTVTASTSYGWGYVGVPSTGATYAPAGVQYTGEDLDDKGIYCYGFQVEAGAGASSYIPTSASQVTRNADYCQSTVASGIASWLTSLTTSTYFVDFVPMTQRGAFTNLWNARTSGGQGYQIYVYDGSAGVNLTCTTKITASTNVENNIASGLALNSRHKLAYSINATAGLRSVNGSTVSAANPIALPSGTVSTFGIGSGGLGSDTPINAWIRSVKYYPTALTQTEINGMTAA